MLSDCDIGVHHLVCDTTTAICAKRSVVPSGYARVRPTLAGLAVQMGTDGPVSRKPHSPIDIYTAVLLLSITQSTSA